MCKSHQTLFLVRRGDIGSSDSIELNVLSHMNAELAQPRNLYNVTRPFSSQRVGSGDETIYPSWAEPNLCGEKRKVGNHAYTRICDTTENLQSNQIAGLRWLKRVLTASGHARVLGAWLPIEPTYS